jgi:hypothetical protein
LSQSAGARWGSQTVCATTTPLAQPTACSKTSHSRTPSWTRHHAAGQWLVAVLPHLLHRRFKLGRLRHGARAGSRLQSPYTVHRASATAARKLLLQACQLVTHTLAAARRHATLMMLHRRRRWCMMRCGPASNCGPASSRAACLNPRKVLRFSMHQKRASMGLRRHLIHQSAQPPVTTMVAGRVQMLWQSSSTAVQR